MFLSTRTFLYLILLFSFVTVTIYYFYNTNRLLDSDTNVCRRDVKILNHRFIPDTLYCPEDAKIILQISNEDDLPEEFESTDLRREKIVLPHQEIKLLLAPLKQGVYKFFGDFHQDTARGTLFVE